MADIIIDIERCKGCRMCILQCPRHLIKMSENMNEQGHNYPVINTEKCTKCGLCCRMCPDIAIRIVESKEEPGENKK